MGFGWGGAGVFTQEISFFAVFLKSLLEKPCLCTVLEVFQMYREDRKNAIGHAPHDCLQTDKSWLAIDGARAFAAGSTVVGGMIRRLFNEAFNCAFHDTCKFDITPVPLLDQSFSSAESANSCTCNLLLC